MGADLATSIYSFVDTIAVGQSEGDIGAVAFAVITPLYGMLVFLGILCGVGGAVLMNNAKGASDYRKGNSYFTVASAFIAMLVIAFWIAFSVFYKDIFVFFGTTEALLPKVMEYAQWIIWFFPIFIAPAFIGAFIRADGSPAYAMKAVVTGGCINIVGDYILVFPTGLGMEGAAIATVIGTCAQTGIMCVYFWNKIFFC